MSQVCCFSSPRQAMNSVNHLVPTCWLFQVFHWRLLLACNLRKPILHCLVPPPLDVGELLPLVLLCLHVNVDRLALLGEVNVRGFWPRSCGQRSTRSCVCCKVLAGFVARVSVAFGLSLRAPVGRPSSDANYSRDPRALPLCRLGDVWLRRRGCSRGACSKICSWCYFSNSRLSCSMSFSTFSTLAPTYSAAAPLNDVISVCTRSK